jgi:hypothetical protein
MEIVGEEDVVFIGRSLLVGDSEDDDIFCRLDCGNSSRDRDRINGDLRSLSDMNKKKI